MRFKLLIATCLCLWQTFLFAQPKWNIKGFVVTEGNIAANANVKLLPIGTTKACDDDGYFQFSKLNQGKYQLLVTMTGYADYHTELSLSNKNIELTIQLKPASATLQAVTVTARKSQNVSGRLRDVSGTAIYAGKKTEVIQLRNINANLSANNTRQIYARIPGLNIWEYNQGGLQLGIGGRGLSPNRSSNFNVRQNGYDISADALGYPESYYTPSAEAVDRIEIIRGAASLQYGPQFGGLVNFVMKEGPKQKKAEFTSRLTGGSFGFLNTFNSIGGTVANSKLNYYGFYQFKRGDDWRPNSRYHQHNAYLHLAYSLNNHLKITGEYTLMNYLAQQPGGLTDAQFASDASVSVRSRNWFKVDWHLISLQLDYQWDSLNRINWRTYTLQGGREALGLLSYINRPDVGGNRDFLWDKYSNLGTELRFIHQYHLSDQLLSTLLVGSRFYQGLTLRKQGDGNDGAGADFSFVGTEPNKSSFRFPGTNLVGFAENIFQLNRHWSITPGFRVEYINTKANGYYYQDNLFIPDEKKEESKTNPRSFALLGIGTSWKFNNGTELYANVSQNYRSINFNDIRVVNANAKVDPALKDETGYNIDLGFRGTFRSWLYADISLFYLKYNNRIGSIFTKDSNFMTYRLRTNLSDSRNQGLEMLLEGDVLKALTGGKAKYQLTLYTNLSLINAVYTNTLNTAIADKMVENVPPLTFRTGASFGNKRWNITYQYSFQDRQYSDATNAESTPTAVDGSIPAFSVMDLSLSHRWNHITLYAGANNLLDQRYYTRRADGYPGPGIIPADKRSYYLTLQLKW